MITSLSQHRGFNLIPTTHALCSDSFVSVVVLYAFPQSTTISVLAADSSEPWSTAPSTLPPTVPLPFPASLFPSQLALRRPCGPSGHGWCDPV